MKCVHCQTVLAEGICADKSITPAWEHSPERCRDVLAAQLRVANDKWWAYERDYILPLFRRAEALGFDLQKAVLDRAGKNSSEIFADLVEERIEHLRDIINEFEWSASDAVSEMSEPRYGLCPACYQDQVEGHRAGCSIGAVFAQKTSETDSACNRKIETVGTTSQGSLRDSHIVQNPALGGGSVEPSTTPAVIEVKHTGDEIDWRLLVNGYGVCMWTPGMMAGRNSDTTAKDYAHEVARVLRLALSSDLRRGLDTSWPLIEVLRRLNDAAKHLLDDHACDTHGHEGIREAQKQAEAYLAEMEKAP